MPVASGSSVPAWPIFAPVARLIALTTPAEVIPPGLSITSQPCSALFSAGLVIFRGRRAEVALRLGGVQQFRSARRGFERGIVGKRDIGRLTQFDAARQHRLQVRR